MARIFISPSKYIQGPGELDNLGTYTKAYGAKPLVIISAGGIRRFGDRVKASLSRCRLGACLRGVQWRVLAGRD
jgi:glycerol dehydrogenase